MKPSEALMSFLRDQMNLSEAIQALKECKKVTREDWSSAKFLHLDERSRAVRCEDDELYWFSGDDFFHGWELYEEPKPKEDATPTRLDSIEREQNRLAFLLSDEVLEIAKLTSRVSALEDELTYLKGLKEVATRNKPYIILKGSDETK